MSFTKYVFTLEEILGRFLFTFAWLKYVEAVLLLREYRSFLVTLRSSVNMLLLGNCFCVFGRFIFEQQINYVF